MRCTLWAVVATVTMLGGLALGGCGGGSQAPPAGSAGLKIAEYAGDGHGGTKPPLDFTTGASVETKALATMLGISSNYVSTAVPACLISFYRLGALGVKRLLVVTLQQTTATEDGDLYLLDGRTSTSGMTCLAYSIRTPTGTADDVNGCVPDWVACELGPTSPWPAATVAVYSLSGAPATKHCRLEADQGIPLTAGASEVPGMVTQYNSKWYYFDALAGTAYTVRLTAGGLGDPDTYVYAADSNHYVGKSVNSGGGDVTFTTGTAARYWVRVHGYLAGKNTYLLRVTSP